MAAKSDWALRQQRLIGVGPVTALLPINMLATAAMKQVPDDRCIE